MNNPMQIELVELKQEIRRRESLIMQCADDAKAHAIAQGRSLMQAREIISESDTEITWSEWVDQELEMSMDAIDRRVKIAQVDQLELQGLTLEQAEKKLSRQSTARRRTPLWIEERTKGVFTDETWQKHLSDLDILLDARDSIDYDVKRAERSIEKIAIHQHNGSTPPDDLLNNAKEEIEQCRENYLNSR